MRRRNRSRSFATRPWAIGWALWAWWALSLFVPSASYGQRQVVGEWGDLFPLPNVAIHTHVLPSGEVMFWGRREWDPDPNALPEPDLDPDDSQPWLLNPTAKATRALKRPGFNVFCAGHTFLPDGRLFVAGGHVADGKGAPRAAVYAPETDSWDQQPEPAPNLGRWYPTAVSLPDGGVLVSFGGAENGDPNDSQRIWRAGQWLPTVNFVFPAQVPPYYPRMHVVPDGRVLMSGPLAATQLLNTQAGEWRFLRPDVNPMGERIRLSSRLSNVRDYAPAVQYAPGKILYAGGGDPPTNVTEILDLNASPPGWTKTTGNMQFARRHHDATLLPDGTVLVTGGTKGNGFNNLNPGEPLRSAERWDPASGVWTLMAKAAVDRCYHATAVLLPDATVLSAGGGEYNPTGNGPNPLKDSHRTAQIFSPPYLFNAAGQPAQRPVITGAPREVKYGDTFQVDTPDAARVARATWVRLSSVTHSLNANQRINVLNFAPTSAAVNVTAPSDPNVCPPGHYMFFLLDPAGVPSVAKIIRIDN